jgi:hypothetical protein
MEIDMYYLINIDSDLSLAEQIALCDTTLYIQTATDWADRRKAETGKNWCVIKIGEIYNTRTPDEINAALGIPRMGRD